MPVDNVNTYMPVATYDAPKIAQKIVDKFIARRPGQMWTRYYARSSVMFVRKLAAQAIRLQQ